METLGIALIVGGVTMAFVYPITLAIAKAYFDCKLEYQNKFFRKFDRDTGAK